VTPPPSTGHFFSRRWRGQAPLRQLFWRDMLVVGSLGNLLFTFVALMLAAQGAGTTTAALVHFAPLPYNLFLFAALLRSPQCRSAHQAAGFVWLVVMTLV
jgi:hypothetical protein